MADLEMGLVSRAIMTGRVEDLVSAGIEGRHFIDPALRAVFETCVEHGRAWRIPLSVDAVRRQHPDFRPEPETNELGYLIREFIDDRSVKFAEKALMDIADMVAKADDPSHPDYRQARKTVVDQFMERTRQYAASIPSSSFTRYSDMGERLVAIRTQQEEGILPGIKLGIPQVDEWTHVVRDTEVVVFCGFGGKGKTTNLVRCTASAYEQGEEVLMVSLEMEANEVWEIFDAHAASLSRTALTRRQLGEDDYGRYEQAAARAKEARNDIVLLDDTDGSPTVDKLAALVEKHRPKVLAVDYLSLLAAGVNTGADWERVTIISRALKQLARSFKIKVYVAAQSSREAASDGPTEFNIAFGNAIFTDCNVMIGVHQDGEMERMKQVQQRLIKNRAGAKGPPGKLHALGYGLFNEYWDRDRMDFSDWTPAHAYMIKAMEGS